MNEPELIHEPHGPGVYLTPEGQKALRAELEHLTLVKRPEIAERIRESQQHGEFSEDNNELGEVKFEQAMVENRIGELKTIFGGAHVLDSSQIPTSHVGLGSFVTVADLDFGDEFEVRLVASVEADPDQDLISNESPLGEALYGLKQGEQVQVETPDGVRKYAIRAIRAHK